MEDAAGFIQERDEGEGSFPSRDGWKTVVFLVGDDEDPPPAAQSGGAGERAGGV